MDQAVTAVLAEYDARARNEQELMREVAAGTVARRLDDLLLHVGPKTGGLLNLLVKEAGARSILDLLSRWNADGRTIVVITHDMSLVAERVPRTVVVGNARILADGPTRHVLPDAELLRTAFLRPPQVTRVAQRLSHFGIAPDTLTVAELHTQLKAVLGGC